MANNNIIDSLSNLSLSEHNSVFISSIKKVVSDRNIKDIFSAISPLSWQSNISQRDILYYDYLIAQSLPEYINMVELSPLNEIWLNSALTPNSQNKIVTTNRSLEVVPDVTTVLSLLGARMRQHQLKEGLHKQITLATSHRQVRAQNYQWNPKFTNHFRVFGMSTIDICKNVLEKEIDIMLDHIKIYLDILNLYERNGLCFNNIKIKISFPALIRNYTKEKGLKIDKLIAQWQKKNIGNKFNSSIYDIIWIKLESEYPLEEILASPNLREDLSIPLNALSRINQNRVGDVPYIIQIDRLSWVNYYHNIAFSIHAENKKGEDHALVDGGSTDRVKKLLNNQKEVNFISWIGSEFIIKYYNKDE